MHAVWFIRNASKFPIRLFLIFSKNIYMTIAYLLLNFLLILAMLFLKNALHKLLKYWISLQKSFVILKFVT